MPPDLPDPALPNRRNDSYFIAYGYSFWAQINDAYTRGPHYMELLLPIGRSIATWLQSLLERIEYQWATLLLGDYNSLLNHDFMFLTCSWFFGSVRIVCRRPEHNMQESLPFYLFQVVSAMMTGALSALHLFYPRAFSISHVYQTAHHEPLMIFYAVSFAHALMLLACSFLMRGRPTEQ